MEFGCRNKPAAEEQLSPSPRKRVTFNSNITTYEHVSVQESIESLTQCNENVGRENRDDLKRTSSSFSVSEDDSSVITSVGSYPPNHRYHNARESDDEAEEYGDSDLDDLDDSDDYDEHSDGSFSGQEVWAESSMESRTEHTATQAIHEGVASREANAFRTRANAGGRNDYINSVLNPIENIAQWKAAKSKGAHQLKPEEKLTAKSEAVLVSFSSEPVFRQASAGFKSKSEQQTKENQEIAVDASLSKWLFSPEITHKKTMSSSQGAASASTPVRSFQDRPILGALTVDELIQISATSSSPRKSPSRSPDEMPIISALLGFQPLLVRNEMRNLCMK